MTARDTAEGASRPSLKKYVSSAARLLNKSPQPLGLMGDRLSKAVATMAGCAMHDANLHFTGLSFEGPLGREEWVAPYNDHSEEISRRVRLVPSDTWLTRWMAGTTHQAPFKPYPKHGPVVLYVHDGYLQVSCGYSADGEKPPMTSRQVLGPNSRFEAANPGGWIAFCPLTDVTMTTIGLQPNYDMTTTAARVLPQTLIRYIAQQAADSIK